MNTEVYVDRSGTVVLNDTRHSMGSLLPALREHPEVAALVTWTSSTLPGGGDSVNTRHGSLFERDRFVTPSNPYDQMRVAYDAATSDDVVSGTLDSMESLAFGRLGIETDDPDEEDIWNQWAEDVDIASRMREIWREQLITSNSYAAVWWGNKAYKVQGKSKAADGIARRRKKVFDNLTLPQGISILDPLRILPVGGFLFNQERLTYVSDWTEKDAIDSFLLGGDASGVEPIIAQLIVGKFLPDLRDRKQIGNLGVDPNRLYLLDPRKVFRMTPTRSQYERFASVRLKSIFEILDAKHQLRQMDRAHLIGAPLRADQLVATPAGWREIRHLRAGGEVFGTDGKPTKVLGVYPQGWLSMYRVTFSDGASIVCDETHLWTVRRPKGDWRTIPLSQIMAEGLFQKNGNNERQGPMRRHRHEIPLCAARELPEADLPLDPYLLGYMLGDGNFDGSPTIACGEPVSDQPWRDVLPPGIKVTLNPANPFEFILTRVARGRQPQGHGDRSNPVTEGLRALGLWGMHSRDKFIPDRYLWASIEQRWALLQGLCDSDGNARVGSPIGTRSVKLADGIVELAQSLGGIAYKRNYPNEGGDFYIVDVQMDSVEPPFRLRRKIAGWRPRKRHVRRTIVAVERVADGEGVCIAVDRPDGLYVAQHEIASHNTNFIVLVKKGSKDRPAQQPEIDALQSGMRSLARVPVIVGDDRLNVEIITPKIDQTLNFDKYAGLDIRVQGRLYGMFITTRSRGDDSIKLARVVARGLEDKRDQQRRAIHKYILNPAYQLNDAFTAPPALRFYPKRIALDFDPALATYLLDLRDRGDLSRDSILAEIDYDEADEARKREYEAEHYDHIFQTQVPFSIGGAGPGAANAPAGSGGPPRATPGQNPGPSNRSVGRTGGRNTGGNRRGGGAAPGSGQGQAPRNGRPATPAARAMAAVEAYMAEVEAGGLAPAERAAAIAAVLDQLPHRTRAHAAAAAAMRARRNAQADDLDDALDAQRAEIDARHAAELEELRAAHAAEDAEHATEVAELEERLAQHSTGDEPTGEEG